MAEKRVTLIIAGTAAGGIRAVEEMAAAAELSAGKMSKTFDEHTSKVGGAFTKLGNGMASFGIPFAGAVKGVGTKMDEAESKGRKFFGTMAALGKLSAGVGVAGFAAVGAESIKLASSWDRSMTLLVTAGGESQSKLAQVSAGAKAAAADTGTSLDQTAAGMYTVEKAGYRGAEGTKVLHMALEGAKAEGTDASTMVNALTSVMMSYHTPASQAAKVTNEMVAAAGASKTTMQDFASALSTVMPVAANAGVSFEQVGGAISTLTQHGTTAFESTQELSNTIRNLQAPNAVAANEMAQLGLSANDVALNLGKRGLTGTIDMITEAITTKMGPSGLVMLNAFKQNKAAAADMQVMLTKMPADVHKLATSYLNGTISMKDYRAGMRALPADHAAMAQQFKALADKMTGFNDLLKSGSPAAQTFTDALKKTMGGANGMNTALMLGGANMSTFKDRVNAITDAGAANGDQVTAWALTQKTFAVEVDKAKVTLQVLGITFGEWLIPKVQAAGREIVKLIGWFKQHITIAKDLAAAIGGILALALASWVAGLAKAVVMSAYGFVKMIAQGAWWVAQQAAQFVKAVALGAAWLAEHVAMGVAYIASNVAMAASATAAFIAENLATLGIAAGIAALIAAIVLLATHWGEVWGFIKKVALDVWQWFDRDVIHPIVDFFVNRFKFALDTTKRDWDDVWGFIKNVAHDAYQWVWVDVLEPLVNFYKTVLVTELNVAKSAWDLFWTGLKDTVSTVWDFLKPIFEAIKSAVKDITGGIKDVVGVASKVGSLVGKGISGIGSMFKASGGPVNAGQGYIVGENGPEWFSPSSSGTIVPNHALGGGKSLSPTYNIVVHGGGPGVAEQIRRALEQHTADLLRGMGMA